MKTFNEGFGGGDSEPSRRDVVKYGAAAAIAVAAGPVMAATAANTVSGFVYENRSGGTRRRAIRVSPASWFPTAATSSRPMPPGATRCRSMKKASSS